jgi:predicted nucleotidyltransferase
MIKMEATVATTMTRAGVDYARESGYEALLRELVLSAVACMPCEVFLFGSRARGAHGRASDFDIGIRGLSEREFESVKRRIEDEVEEGPIPHDIDIVDFDRVSEPFRSAALKDRIIWKSV